MEILKQFLRMDYYQSVLKGQKNLRSMVAAIFLALIITAMPSFLLIKDGLPFVQGIESKVTRFLDRAYPQGLEVDIKDGAVSTNVEEPFTVKVSERDLSEIFLNENSQSNEQFNLLTIDTKADTADYEKYGSAVLLTEKGVVYKDKEKLSVYPLNEVKNFIITKDVVLGGIRQFNEGNWVEKVLVGVILVMPFVMFLGIFLYVILTLLFYSLLIFIMSKILNTKLAFSQIFAFTSALVFMPWIIWQVISMIPTFSSYLQPLGSVFLMVVLTIAYINIRKIGGASK